MNLSMEETPLVVLLLSGLVTHSASINRKYYYVDRAMRWTEAQSYCRKAFTDLATVENDDDNRKLLTPAPTFQQDTNAWIGLYDDYKAWKWSLQDESFYGDGEADFRSWNNGHPNNLHDNQHCVWYDLSGWNDRECSKRQPFICTDANGSYFLIMKLYTWPEAQAYCRMHYRDLASIRNQKENNKVNEIKMAKGIKLAWIGLYREPWHPWSDNSPSNFTNWQDGQPRGVIYKLCTVVSTASGKWLNSDCGNKLPFFCYRVITTKIIFKTVLHSAADMNSKDIQDQLSKQLQARLAPTGVTNITIRVFREDRPPSKFNNPPVCP